jgi:DNA-binding IclR family transcriptional regulator
MARQYLKLTSDWDEDERVAPLSDQAQLTWIKILSRAKRQRPGGSFGSLAHLEALLPPRLHRHIKVLIAAGLLQKNSERVEVTNWSRYQIDPTVAERSQRHRATVLQRQSNADATVRDTRHETRDTRHKTNNSINARDGKLMSIGEILKGGA